MTQIRRAESKIVSHSDPTCQTPLSLRVQRLVDLRSASSGMLKRKNRHNSLTTEMRIPCSRLHFQKPCDNGRCVV